MNATVAITISIIGITIGWTIMVIHEVRQRGPTVKLIRRVARDRRAAIIALIFPLISIVMSIIEEHSSTFDAVISTVASALLATIFGLAIGTLLARRWPWKARHPDK